MKDLKLDERVLKNPKELVSFIETHYLQGGDFRLQFQVENLLEIEKVFDQIIQKHGIYKASFEFDIILNENRNPGYP